MQCIRRRGFWAVIGPKVDEIARQYISLCPESYRALREERDGDRGFHLTLQPCCSATAPGEELSPDVPKFVVLGVARYDRSPYDVYYVILRSPSEKKFFHITLGFRDVDYHGEQKYDLKNVMIRWSPGLDCMELANDDVHILRSMCAANAMSDSQQSVYHYLECKRAFQEKRWSDLARWLQTAREQKSAIHMEASQLVMEYCMMFETCRMRERSLLERAVESAVQGDQDLPLKVRQFVQKEWNQNFVGTDSADTRNRERVAVMRGIENALGFHELPRFFQWVVPHFLAGMSIPRNREDMDALYQLGIRRCVTVMETPLSSGVQHSGIEFYHLECDNYKAPVMDRLLDCVRWIRSNDRPCMVHCGGGKGRTGLVLACYLAAFGTTVPGQGHVEVGAGYRNPLAMSSSDAVALVRALRPGSIETTEQEEFVRSFCDVQFASATSSASSATLGARNRAFLMGQQPAVVLCGLPGAGKSTVSHILRTQFENVEIVCQDDMVKGRSTEDEIARIVHDQRKLLVIDRCNVTIKDREQIAQWLGDRRKILLCMDTMVNLCADRARARQEHPTLAADRAASVISMLNKKYVRPSPQTDKLYDAVFVVRSDDELAHFFALQFGFVWESTFEAVPAHTPILKFPRTPHIVSLGSATRDDLIMEEDPDSLFSCANATKHLVVEEKIDGANLGISLTEDYRIVCQNRSHYVTSESHPQFHDLDKWLHRFESNLCRLLVPGRHILYGEWMSTTHSVHYDALPGLFVAFDLYDRFTAKFLSRDSLEHLFTSLYITIPLTPVLHRGPFEAHWKDVLLRLIHERSCFSSSEKREGVYVRIMDEENQWLLHRCKLVRGDFLAEGTAHWTRGPVRANRMTARFK